MSGIAPVRRAEGVRWRMHRSRVDDLFRQRPVVHIVAPAGYGKSMAARQWARSLPGGTGVLATLRQEPSAGDQGWAHLPADLAAAIIRTYGRSDVRTDGGEEHPATPASDSRLLILDDLDLVPVASRIPLLELAEHWVLTDPAHHQLVAISRTPLPPGTVDPQFPRRFIGPADLAFDREEITACMAQWARPPMPGMDAAALQALTGGWPTALAFAEDGVPAGAIDHAWFPLDTYLRTEILDQLPAVARPRFLGCWPLDVLEAGVWEAIDDGTGCSFDDLVHVVPLTTTLSSAGCRTQAIPEIVRQRLRQMAGDLPDPASGARMVRYWLQRERFDQAALVASRLDAWDEVLPVLRERCAPLALRDFHADVIDLLKPFPSSVISADPDLGFWLALAELSSAQFGEGGELAEAYASRATDAGSDLEVGRCLVLRTLQSIFRGESNEALRLARLALDVLPPEACQERFRALATTDVLASYLGDTDLANRAFGELIVVRDRLPADQRWWYTFVVPNRADWLLKTGQMPEAEQLLLHQLRSSTEEFAGILRVRLAIIALEQDQPDRAASWLAEGGGPVPVSYWWLEAALTNVRVLVAKRQMEAATDELYTIIDDRNRFQSPVDIFRPQLMLAEIWVQEGQLALAETWLHLASRSLDTWPRSFGHPIPGLVRARLEMVRQRWQGALGILRPLAEEGRRRQQGGLLIQVLAHIAFAEAAMGEVHAAQETATQAIEEARGGLYVASFHVLGVNIRDFLVRDPLLVIRGRKHAAQQLTVLSDREVEVLQMVAAGLSNSAIADRLYISRYTVKNHLARIYSRLGAGNRQEAVSIASNMGLLTRSKAPRA